VRRPPNRKALLAATLLLVAAAALAGHGEGLPRFAAPVAAAAAF
jgi:hypothetical protein